MEYLLLLAQFTKEIKMGLFTNTEKKIANAIAGSFTKVEAETSKVEAVVTTDFRKTIELAKNKALAANALVNKLKADLQDALVAARDAHQEAVTAAQAAQAAAEADVEKFKAMVIAHTADMNTQASQIVTPPPVVDAPVTAAELSGDGVTATVEPETPPQQ
jgi:hypothetical protein